MRTIIDIDEDLMEKAQQLTKIKTKKAVVQKALQLLVQLENQSKILDLVGKVKFDDEAYKY